MRTSVRHLPEGGRRLARRALFLALAAGCPTSLAAQSAIPLIDHQIESAHVEGGGHDLNVPDSTTFYQVDLPDGTQVMEVRLESRSGDADLYVGPTLSFDPFDYPFQSTNEGLKREGATLDALTDPAISSHSTWFVAVHGYQPTDYDLLVSWGSAGDAAPLENGRPVTGHAREGLDILVFPDSTLYYQVDIGSAARSLRVTITGIPDNGDADLFVGRTLSASPQAYDFISATIGPVDEEVEVSDATDPSPSDSLVWYIAVHGYYESDFTLTATWEGGPAGPTFLRGDCNGDRALDISDAIAQLVALFESETVPCQAACDSNGDDLSDISDAVFSLAYMFLSGPAPTAPFPACGAPPQAIVLSCDAPTACGR